MPNNGMTPKLRGRIQEMIAKLRREGWCNGIPDLTIAVPNKDYHGLYIEFKDVGKTYCTVSDDQREKLQALTQAGYLAVWCAGFDKAKIITKEYMKNR